MGTSASATVSPLHEAIRTGIPFQRLGRRGIAAAVVFAPRHLASWVGGVNPPVDGGQHRPICSPLSGAWRSEQPVSQPTAQIVTAFLENGFRTRPLKANFFNSRLSAHFRLVPFADALFA